MVVNCVNDLCVDCLKQNITALILNKNVCPKGAIDFGVI